MTLFCLDKQRAFEVISFVAEIRSTHSKNAQFKSNRIANTRVSTRARRTYVRVRVMQPYSQSGHNKLFSTRTMFSQSLLK